MIRNHLLFLLSFHLIVCIVQIWLSIIPENNYAVPFTAIVIMNMLELEVFKEVFLFKRLADFQKYALIKIRLFNFYLMTGFLRGYK